MVHRRVAVLLCVAAALFASAAGQTEWKAAFCNNRTAGFYCYAENRVSLRCGALGAVPCDLLQPCVVHPVRCPVGCNPANGRCFYTAAEKGALAGAIAVILVVCLTAVWVCYSVWRSVVRARVHYVEDPERAVDDTDTELEQDPR